MNTSKPHLLIVDDEPTVVYTLKCILEQVDYKVTAAVDLDEAAAALRREKVNVMICDLSLKNNVSGLQVIEKAREIQPGVPCILLTGFTEAEEIEELEEQGIPVFYKPVEISRLLSELRRYTELKAA